MEKEAEKLIADFDRDDRGFRFFGDFADAMASAEVSERAQEMQRDRRS